MCVNTHRFARCMTVLLVALEHVCRRVTLWLKTQRHMTKPLKTGKGPIHRANLLPRHGFRCCSVIFSDLTIELQSPDSLFVPTAVAGEASTTLREKLRVSAGRLKLLLLTPPLGLHLRNLTLHGFLWLEEDLDSNDHNNLVNYFAQVAAQQQQQQQEHEEGGAFPSSHALLWAIAESPQVRVLLLRVVQQVLSESITLFGNVVQRSPSKDGSFLAPPQLLPLPGFEEEPLRVRAFHHAEKILADLGSTAFGDDGEDLTSASTDLAVEILILWTVVEQRLRWQFAIVLSSDSSHDDEDKRQPFSRCCCAKSIFQWMEDISFHL